MFSLPWCSSHPKQSAHKMLSVAMRLSSTCLLRRNGFDDSFLILSRGDLNSQAIDALESFFACDRDFL